MLRLALYIDNGTRCMRVATVDDPALIKAAAHAAVEEAKLRAAALEESDAEVSALQYAEAHKLEEFFSGYFKAALGAMM